MEQASNIILFYSFISSPSIQIFSADTVIICTVFYFCIIPFLVDFYFLLLIIIFLFIIFHSLIETDCGQF